MSPKSKRITQNGPYFSFLSGIESQIQPRIKGFVIGKMVDGWRDRVVDNCQDSSNAFNSSRRTQQVPGHRLGTAYVQFISVIAKYLLNGPDLADIPKGGRCAVDIDIIDVFWVHVCILESELHHIGSSPSLGVGCGKMIGVC